MRRYSVITERCVQDLHCVAACLRHAIHPLPGEGGFEECQQLFIHPRRCIGCGACVSACENGAIFEVEELPESLTRCVEANAAWYAQ